MTQHSRDSYSGRSDSPEENQTSGSPGVRSGDPNQTPLKNASDIRTPDGGATDASDFDDQSPVLATLVERAAEPGETVRVGSPFAGEPQPLFIDRPIEVVIDGGPVRYTAMGAVASAAMVLGFAAAAAWWFPAGGTMIAALGCVLSILGLYSHHRYTAGCLLLLHLALFIVSYGRSLS